MRYKTIFFIMLLAVSCPVFAWGDDFSLVPSLSVKEDYNSNILFSTTDVEKDFITTLSPGVEMVDRTGRLDTDVLVRLDRLEYADYQALNATNQLYNGTLHYSVSPLFSVSAAAGYSKNSNPSLLGIGTTGIIFAAAPWNHVTYSLSADYQFNELTVGTLSYSNGRDYYDNPQYLSDTTRNINAGLVYDLGKYFPTLKGRMNVGYSYYDYPDSRIDSVMGTVGFSKDLNEVWSVQVDGGISNTWSKILFPVQLQIIGFPVIITVPISNEGLGWVSDVSLSCKGEVGSASLTYNRGITPAYGLNGAAEQNTVTISSRYRFSYELSAIFSGSYYTLKSFASEFTAQSLSQQGF
ncbi:MAG TPA: hypothetical protein VEJ88_05360, partial [Dissulfurispiraceae bacterium]|nr:hypothetical protein [Dissulfurispiraceae bacterium]